MMYCYDVIKVTKNKADTINIYANRHDGSVRV